MLKITPESEIPDIFNLPLYRAEKIATAVSDDGTQFAIYAGLTRSMVEQLKAHSLDQADTELQKTTRDYTRFGLGSYEEWYGKGRMPFALVAEPDENKNEILAALVWYGPKVYPLAERTDMVGKDAHTASHRSYVPYRGKHIMTDFSLFTQNLYIAEHSDIVFWIETISQGGMGLFRKLGFKETGEISPLGKTVMVLEQ